MLSQGYVCDLPSGEGGKPKRLYVTSSSVPQNPSLPPPVVHVWSSLLGSAAKKSLAKTLIDTFPTLTRFLEVPSSLSSLPLSIVSRNLDAVHATLAKLFPLAEGTPRVLVYGRDPTVALPPAPSSSLAKSLVLWSHSTTRPHDIHLVEVRFVEGPAWKLVSSLEDLGPLYDPVKRLAHDLSLTFEADSAPMGDSVTFYTPTLSSFAADYCRTEITEPSILLSPPSLLAEPDSPPASSRLYHLPPSYSLTNKSHVVFSWFMPAQTSAPSPFHLALDGCPVLREDVFQKLDPIVFLREMLTAPSPCSTSHLGHTYRFIVSEIWAAFASFVGSAIASETMDTFSLQASQTVNMMRDKLKRFAKVCTDDSLVERLTKAVDTAKEVWSTLDGVSLPLGPIPEDDSTEDAEVPPSLLHDIVGLAEEWYERHLDGQAPDATPEAKRWTNFWNSCTFSVNTIRQTTSREPLSLPPSPTTFSRGLRRQYSYVSSTHVPPLPPSLM